MTAAYERTTGATPDPKTISQLAKIMETTESDVDDDEHLEETTALMYAAFEAGQEAK